MKLSRILDTIIALIFPPKCELCSKVKDISRRGELCPECAERFAADIATPCPSCGRSIGMCTEAEYGSDFGDIPPCVLGYYIKDKSNAPHELIFKLKKRRDSSAYVFFGRLLGAELMKHLLRRGLKPGEMIVTYPPRSEDNLREYGFDHGERLAKAIADFTGAKFVRLICRSKGEEQKSLGKSDREHNAESTLRLADGADLTGKSVIIVDDIITTGATLKASVRLMREAGADFVSVAAILKNPPIPKRKPQKPKNDKLWFE